MYRENTLPRRGIVFSSQESAFFTPLRCVRQEAVLFDGATRSGLLYFTTKEGSRGGRP
jgi:hypothetical protein